MLVTKRIKIILVAVSMLSACVRAATPVVPDGGVIQQSSPVIERDILPESDIDLSRPLPEPSESLGKGPKVIIKEVIFSGNTVLSDQQLKLVIDSQLDRAQDFIGLKNIATKVTRYYRQMGYFMATAYLPQQDISDKSLKIEILEGLLGGLALEIDGRIDEARMRGYFEGLASTPLSSSVIERKLRLLADRGVAVQGTFSPGARRGETNLGITAKEQPLLQGNLTLDNKGNRYTNAVRGGTILQLNDPAGYGGRYLLSLVSGGTQYSYIALDADLPIGYDGLALKLGYSNTHYELGEEFSALDANGKSDTFKIGLHYPWRRSLNSNIYTDVNYRLSQYDDSTLTLQTSDRKIKSVDFSLYGDFSNPGNRTDWSAKLEVGNVEDKVQQDPIEGSFSKMEISLQHNRLLGDNFTIKGAISGQHSSTNLASAHKFSLGGADAVRAYPQGEGLVDVGVLSSVELFYRFNSAWTFSGFVDAGFGETKKHSAQTNTDNTKKLSGIGASVVYRHQSLGNVSVTAAWRSDTEAITAPDKEPRLWLQWAKKFN